MTPERTDITVYKGLTSWTIAFFCEKYFSFSLSLSLLTVKGIYRGPVGGWKNTLSDIFDGRFFFFFKDNGENKFIENEGRGRIK